MSKILHWFFSSLHRHFTGIEPPPGFLPALGTLAVLLTMGTFFYSSQEGWSLFDSFYFTVVTITTVGYGDLLPTTVASKSFTMFLIFMGVGLGVFVISTFADSFQKGREKRYQRYKNLLQKVGELET